MSCLTGEYCMLRNTTNIIVLHNFYKALQNLQTTTIHMTSFDIANCQNKLHSNENIVILNTTNYERL